MNRRMVAWVVGALVVGVLAALSPPSTGRADAAPLPIQYERDEVWDGRGRLFVTHDASYVSVFDAAGSLVDQIAVGGSPTDLAARDGYLFVSELDADAIHVIDLDDLTTVAVFPVGMQLRPGGIVPLPDAIWFIRATTPYGSLGRIDLQTGAASAIATDAGAVRWIGPVAGDDSTLFAGERRPSAPEDEFVRLSATAPHGRVGAVVADIDAAVADPTGTVAWSTGDRLREWNLTTMTETDRVLLDPPEMSGAVASTTARGGLLASAGGPLTVFQTGQPTPSHRFSPGVDCVDRIDFSVDATEVQAVGSCGASIDLDRYVLSPSIGSVTPSTVVSGVPTELTITGQGLGGSATATVGGFAAPVTAADPTAPRVDVPTALEPGTHELGVTTAWGTATTTITVLPNQGATVGGTVNREGEPVGGALVQLHGAALGPPRQTTTSPSGDWQFAAVPHGIDYRIEVDDPAPGAPDQVIGAFELRPNDHTDLDVELSGIGGAEQQIARTLLPDRPNDLVTVPASNRVVVSSDDSVVIADGEGRVVARVLGLPGAGDLEVVGDRVHVLLPASGEVVELDPSTGSLIATRSFGRPMRNALAATTGVLWSPDDDVGRLTSLDLTTGAVTSTSLDSLSGVTTIDGSASSLYAQGIFGYGLIVDVSGPTPTITATDSSNYGQAFHGDATRGVGWYSNGVEVHLDDLTPTGVVLPRGFWTAVPPSSSPARGGVFALGANVYRTGIPQLTHAVPVDVATASGFDAAGDRIFSTSETELLAFTLAPTVHTGHVATSAMEVITFTGAGLGAAGPVLVDGQPVLVHRRDTDQVEVEVAGGVPAGPHTIEVLTPWGSTGAVPFLVVTPLTIDATTHQIPTRGGTVTIRGTGFTEATSVRAGSVDATSFTILDDSTIEATFPASMPKSGLVEVTTPYLTAEAGVVKWVAPVPVVTDVSPDTSALIGGSEMVITGTGLSFATTVWVGAVSVPVTGASDTEVRITAPGRPAGVQRVSVTTPGGSSNGIDVEYLPTLPGISGVTPASGPTGGGTLVAIEGAGFATAVDIRVGGASAGFSIVDDTTVYAVVPPGSPGPAQIEVETPTGTSRSTTGAWFTYVAPPGSIEGQVRNLAGPVAGMVVVVSPADRLEARAHTRTGPDGRYVVAGLEPGTYKVLVLDPAVLFGSPSYHIGEFYDDAGTTLDDFAGATTVEVSAGAPTQLRSIALRHSMPGAITGLVTRPGGAPLAGMLAVALPTDEQVAVASAITGPDGTYRIEGLDPGRYRLAVLDPYLLFGLPPRWIGELYDGRTSWDDVTLLEVTAGGTSAVPAIDLEAVTP